MRWIQVSQWLGSFDSRPHASFEIDNLNVFMRGTQKLTVMPLERLIPWGAGGRSIIILKNSSCGGVPDDVGRTSWDHGKQVAIVASFGWPAQLHHPFPPTRRMRENFLLFVLQSVRPFVDDGIRDLVEKIRNANVESNDSIRKLYVFRTPLNNAPTHSVCQAVIPTECPAF